MNQTEIPAVYMRGGSSKGVFFHAGDLPAAGPERDELLLKVIGSPDPYGKQVNGMGCGSSSTSKVVIIRRSERDDCDVDYLFGAPAIGEAVIDWSGNCGNLTSAVGPFAINEGLIDTHESGIKTVRIWQENIQKRIVARVPVENGRVIEHGSYTLDGVSGSGAEIVVEFLDPGAADSLLPTGNTIDEIDVPGIGRIALTLINAGNPAIFVEARDVGLTGTETQDQVNGDSALLARLELIRAHGAVAMGLTSSAEEATQKRPHTPKLCLLAVPQGYVAAGGKQVAASDIDVIARFISMGKLHHAITGTGAIGVAVAATINGTLVHRIAGDIGEHQARIGHTAGVVTVGASTTCDSNGWSVEKAVMSRTARRLMKGVVLV